MNFEALESHIGLTASEKEGNTLEDLTSYIRKFLYTIPFEAIDIYNGRTISTDVQTNIDKFTKKHRGGLCYENNVVTNAYLTARGFDTIMVAGYVKPPKREWKKRPTHLTNIVTIDNQHYLADTGFGHFPSQPIPLNGEIVEDEDDIYRIIYDEDARSYYVQTTKQAKENWIDLLNFKREPRGLIDFMKDFDYTVFNPEYNFKHHLLINKKTDNGHITMTENHVNIIKNGQKQQIDVTPINYQALLKQYFNIETTIPALEQ
ncbi:arylamine N-acetyltransferase [Staphylococcus schleiferi subsp. coagulans]|uniref:arylamine N-acetyltransferase family protein n=1 Tax=Staphylococcus coagulans TaxID=74706 RepID=UPI0015FD5CB4|nr:arylamine N-acetyltransferase [Staphylococcus coagulans]MBA8779243.1 arylamine N-acetyltransferase [Staphylococcus coagulans]